MINLGVQLKADGLTETLDDLNRLIDLLQKANDLIEELRGREVKVQIIGTYESQQDTLT